MGDTATVSAEPSKSFPARVLGVFWSPGETFAEIARQPGFIAPLILLIIASVATVETMMARIGMERIVRASLEANGQAAKMDPAQLQQTVQRAAMIGGIVTHIAGVIGPAIYLLIVAAFGLLVVNAIFGERVSFKKIFSITCYAFVPTVLGSLIAIAVFLFGDPEHFNPASPAPVNLGFFLDPQSTSKAVLALANSLDIFVIWFLVLISIGLSASTERRVKTASIALVFFGVWIVIALAKAGFAMMMG